MKIDKNKWWVVCLTIVCIFVGGGTLFYKYFWTPTLIKPKNATNEEEESSKYVKTEKDEQQKSKLSNKDVFGELDTRFFYKFLRVDNSKKVIISKLLVMEVVKQIIKNLKMPGEKVEFAYKWEKTKMSLGVRWVDKDVIVYKYYTFRVKENFKPN